MHQAKEGRGHASWEDIVDTSIKLLEDYIKKEQRKTDCSEQKNTNNTRINRKQLENKNVKKNNYIDISGDKRAKSLTGELGHG